MNLVDTLGEGSVSIEDLVINLILGAVLSIILAVYLAIDGVVEIAAALKIRPASGWGCLLAGGIFSLLLGGMIWRQFPLAGAWAIGLLLGIKLVLVGMIMIGVGSITRSKA